MVLFFESKAVDPNQPVTIYMGRDKFESKWE